ncbi:hypothetical protein B14911_13012 [Bacillus sp. NRRL B-14911]|uniref:DUF3231 family protein n=1 Tax=Bacillus infantis NRRL B-14911 TaxID=1367477 RepID=U5LJA4_9BACI|nr:MULTISPECIES: DUF3231 family protein [Bacillus]AGX06771.1 hypothetical protein N288_24695 [Bacillus infantis NRRL B-14911]EAR67685.1 hypothetical protein B14911_13012 [Bacillus sp. NRRL B-14911]
MNTIKPIKAGTNKTSPKEPLTSAEMGKLWATYMGNSMSKGILAYYLHHVDDHDIKALLENASKLCTEFLTATEGLLKEANFPIPDGFNENDVNLEAPRLFHDDFYVHYLKYAAKAGISIYSVGYPIVFRNDIVEFFRYCTQATLDLMDQIKEILMKKGLIIKPPFIPVPKKVDYAQKDFLNGFLGRVRPLHALEIAHLYDNIENNVTSKAFIMAFAQTAKSEKIRQLFQKGASMTHSNLERYMQKLHDENLPSPTFLDDLVTDSTFAPFSDKLMLFHKMDMFSMKIRAFGNSLAVNGRHDIGLLYSRSLMNITHFVTEASDIMMENGWMEKPPEAAERQNLASK